MIKNDRQYGAPFVLYRETKANIEAIAGIQEGATAYATDSNEFGTFNGATWDWGQGGSGGGHTIQDDGTPVADRANLNFTGDGVTVTDDSMNDATVITIAGADGWTSLSTQPTRTAADDPTYTLQFASVDYRDYLAEGTPIKWTQNSIVRYGFINAAPVYSGGNTTATVLTRLDSSSTDYDVLDTGTHAITGFSVGLPKQPGRGFPIIVSAWTLLVTDSSNLIQSTPTALTWYNLLSVSVPIGSWFAKTKGRAQVLITAGTTSLGIRTTLSTTSSTESNQASTTNFAMSGSGLTLIGNFISHEFVITLTSKTTHYLNLLTGTASCDSLAMRGDLSRTELIFRCAYL